MTALSYDQLPPPPPDAFEEPGHNPEAPDHENQEEETSEFVLKLEEISGKGIDLAFVLPDDVLGRIAAQCLEGYERDKAERAEWEADYDKTAAMLGGKREQKTFPWPGSSNVIYPLIATASLQFGARAYPAMVKGQDVVKARVIGEDETGEKLARGNRIKEHMNWQLLEDMPEWEDETDKLVHMLPWQGCVFRQAIWDETYTRPKTSLISAKCLVMTQNAKDLETIPLFCKEFTLFPHELTERMRDGRYVEKDIRISDEETRQGEQDMLECHCRYDLDDDDYTEPYIAVIHKDTGELLSLKAGFWPSGVEREQGEPDPVTQQPTQGRVIRVRRHVEFTKYDFIPDFEGRFLGIGFGFLLREHNTIINTLLNQLIDAATDQNLGGGFIGKGMNLKGGALNFERGEWKMVNTSGDDIRKAIVQRPTSQPSPVLFQLLGLMIEAGKELASIRDALSGEVQANQPATTTLAIIEQGLQVFSSIYKRIYRSLGKELKLIFQLNGAYLPETAYYNVMDTQKAIAREDYNYADNDVCPVADPSITTSAQRLAKAQFLDAFKGDPDVDQRELKRRQMEAAEIEDIDKLLPEPDPQAAQLQGLAAEASIRKDETAADLNAAKAEGETIKAAGEAQKIQLEPVNLVMDAASRANKARTDAAKSDGRGMGRLGGMAGAAADQAPAGVAEIPLTGLEGPMDGIGMDQPAALVGQPAPDESPFASLLPTEPVGPGNPDGAIGR